MRFAAGLIEKLWVWSAGQNRLHSNGVEQKVLFSRENLHPGQIPPSGYRESA